MVRSARRDGDDVPLELWGELLGHSTHPQRGEPHIGMSTKLKAVPRVMV